MTEEKTTPARKTVTAKYTTPHVHTAMAAILKSLSVEKGATLPTNMGGKPYITAVDLNMETKRLLVANDLFIIPTEREVSKEILNDNGRKTITVSIEGTYQIVSTVDGSSVTIGGVGDGLATGSAVASNIASTNALKNALLRTFLVTEQSTEDAAKNGPKDETTPAAVTRAKQGESAPAPTTSGGLNAARQALVGITGDQASAKRAGDEFFGVGDGQPSEWSADEGQIRKLIEYLKSKGE